MNDMSYLLRSVYYGGIHVLQKFLDAGGDPNTVTTRYTPFRDDTGIYNHTHTNMSLLGAIITMDFRNSHQAAEILISAGADVNAIDSNGNSIFHNAIKNGNMYVLDLIITNPNFNFDVDTVDHQNKTPLISATSYVYTPDDRTIMENFGNGYSIRLEMVKRILSILNSSGKSIYRSVRSGDRAFFNSIMKRDKEIGMLLIDHGVDPFDSFFHENIEKYSFVTVPSRIRAYDLLNTLKEYFVSKSLSSLFEIAKWTINHNRINVRPLPPILRMSELFDSTVESNNL